MTDTRGGKVKRMWQSGDNFLILTVDGELFSGGWYGDGAPDEIVFGLTKLLPDNGEKEPDDLT